MCPSSAALHGCIVKDCPILVALGQGSLCQCDQARQQTKGEGHSQKSFWTEDLLYGTLDSRLSAMVLASVRTLCLALEP